MWWVSLLHANPSFYVTFDTQAKRQARKLNFLITQTELYAHFMAKKITGATEEDKTQILNRMDEKEGLKLHNAVLDDYGTPVWWLDEKIFFRALVLELEGR